MTRLDVWLVEQGHFTSRQSAKRAIRAGHILVDGKPAKPSTSITGKEEIVISDKARDLPIGYTKLQEIDTILENQLVSENDLALDVGCSAGGFLWYLLEHGAKVIGIEISDQFFNQLQMVVEEYQDLSLIIDDAFTIDPQIVCESKALDLLLIDVTTEPEGSLKLVDRFSALLKHEGRLLVSLKMKPEPDKITSIIEQITRLGYRKIREVILDPSRQEVHVVATFFY